MNGSDFEFFRLDHSKEAVDICPNTLREYEKEGLPFYRKGRAVYVSKSELALFIRMTGKRPQCVVETTPET